MATQLVFGQTQLDTEEAAHAEGDVEIEDAAMQDLRDVAFAEALQQSTTVICIKCKLQCDPFKAIIKSKSRLEPQNSKYVCRGCNSVCAMLQRQMRFPPCMFGELSEEQQKNFWRACRETAADDSRFVYNRIRACLVKTLCTRKTIEDAVEYYSEPKPLDVWKQLGYNVADIESKGKSEIHPVFGKVWSFHMKRVSTKTTLATVEEHIQKAEQKVKYNKQSGGDAEEDDDFDALESSEDEPPAKKSKSSQGKKAAKSKPSKKTKSSEEKAEATRQKKEQAKMLKHNSAQHTLAVKSVAALTAPVNELTMALDTMKGSMVGRFPQNVEDMVRGSLEVLSGYKNEASELAGKPVKSHRAYVELGFDQKGLAAALAASKATLKNFNEMLKIVSR